MSIAANILANNEEGSHFVIANISYIDLFQDTVFTRKLFQKNPIPKEVKQHLAKQILEIVPTDRGFIMHLFDDLQLNDPSQTEAIKELLRQIRSSSDQMQVAIAHTIIERYSRGPEFLVRNIDLFNHTQELADILTKTSSVFLIIHFQL